MNIRTLLIAAIALCLPLPSSAASKIQEGRIWGAFKCNRVKSEKSLKSKSTLGDILLGSGWRMNWISSNGPGMMYDECDVIGEYNICYGNEATQRLIFNINTKALSREFGWGSQKPYSWRESEAWQCHDIRIEDVPVN